MKKYRVMRIDNLVDDITERIKIKYFPTIPKAALLNEFTFRHYKEHFPEEVEEAKAKREQEQENASL